MGANVGKIGRSFVFESIFRFLLASAAKWKPLFRVVAYARLQRRRGRALLRNRPLAALSLFVLLGVVYVAYSIKEYILPDVILQKHACYAVKLKDNELYDSDGDTLKFADERPCDSKQVVALEFYNWSNVSVTGKGPFHDMVSSGILLKESLRGYPKSDGWHEYTIFHEGNNFSWVPISTNYPQQVALLRNQCGFNPKDVTIRDRAEIQEGVIIFGGLRSSPDLERKTWQECNYGSPQNPDFRGCKYLKLQFFIPTETLARHCVIGSNLEKLTAPGTRKITFVGSSEHKTLRSLAQDRWSETRARSIPREEWDRLSINLPKLCMRWVGEHDEELRALSQWSEFASITSVWCDY